MPFDLDVADAHHGLPAKEPDMVLELTDTDPLARIELPPSDDYLFTRPATRIVVTGPDDEIVTTIETPELVVTRADVDPKWRAPHDAEQKEPSK